MKHLIESLIGRVRKIRNNPEMAPTHLALAIQETGQILEQIDTRLEALEARQAKVENARIDWALGAMVPTSTENRPCLETIK